MSGSPSDPSRSPKRRRLTSTGPRPTQRIPKSCLGCTRRKTKCDKEQPCKSCVDRGEADECRREVVFVKGAVMTGDLTQKAITIETLARELALLRERVAMLEAGKGQRAETPTVEGRLPGTMEEVALGIGESIRWKGTSLLATKEDIPPNHQWYQPVPFETSLAALPSRQIAETLVLFYLDHVSWMSCIVHGPTLMKDHDAFWSKMERREVTDDLWLGMLFAVLCMSALFMDEEEAIRRGLFLDHLQTYGTTWFDSAIAILFRCGIWTRPTLLSSQILQILSPAFHLTGNTNLHQSLTGVDHTHIRAINLHLLGSDMDDDSGWHKEIGRRIWWSNVESDWIFVPYHRYALLPPDTFNTAMPSRVDGHSPISDGAITLAYRTACFKSARLVYNVYGNLAASEESTYEKVMAAMYAHESIVMRLPPELRFDPKARPTALSVEETRRRLLALTLAYRSYQIHRSYFVKSINDPIYERSQRACLEAANTIEAVASLGLPPVYYRLWNVTVSLVAAGLVLAIRLALAPVPVPADDVTRLKVVSLVQRLHSMHDRSGIATRGATFISHLLQTEHDGQGLRFTREAILNMVQGESQPSLPADTDSLDMFSGLDSIPNYDAEFDFTSLLNEFMTA